MITPLLHIRALQLLLVSSIVVFTAATCEKEVKLNLGKVEPRLVVVSNFTVGRPLEVFVSQTESVFLPDTSHKAIEDAIVEVYQNNRFIERLEFVEVKDEMRYFYRSKTFRPEVGVQYTLKVQAFGLESISANNAVPESVKLEKLTIDNINSEYSADNTHIQHSFRVQVAFNDPPGVENYYHLILQQQRILVNNGGDNIQKPYLYDDSPMLVNPIHNSNSVNAYLLGGVLISDKGNDGQLLDYSFDLEFETEVGKEILGKLKAEFRTVTEDYYRYYVSSSNQARSAGAPYSEPVFVHNNIENGYGVFAGYSSYTDSLDVAQ